MVDYIAPRIAPRGFSDRAAKYPAIIITINSGTILSRSGPSTIRRCRNVSNHYRNKTPHIIHQQECEQFNFQTGSWIFSTPIAHPACLPTLPRSSWNDYHRKRLPCSVPICLKCKVQPQLPPVQLKRREELHVLASVCPVGLNILP